MRALVVARNRHPVPPDMLPAIADGFRAWRDQYKSKMEAFHFFVTSNGGFGIANVADESELYQMLLDWPLTPFSDIEVDLIVDGDVALQQWADRVAQMA